MHYENAEFHIGKATYLSTDVGGVVEFYPSWRMVTRLDEGKRLLEKKMLSRRQLQGFVQFLFPKC